MNSCILQGRLCNQMFEIAAAYSHAKRNGFEYCIPPVSADEQIWPSARYPRLNYGKFKGEVYQDPAFHYTPIPAEDGLVLNGYFQSLKYFEEYQQELCEVFGFVDTVLPGTCAVHCRRTDYIQYSSQFNLLPHTWYQNAINEIQQPGMEFHFYSDDIEWCKEVFPGHVYHHGLPIHDLHAMAQHEHMIMSASSFSWWAALNISGTIIAPKTWFGPSNAHHNTKDIYLDHWIKM